MKKIVIILMILILLPVIPVHAQEYSMKAKKEITAAYAGPEEDNYNYFKMKPSKNGYAQIKIKTSNKKSLTFDICNENKEVIASDITVDHKKSVLHKVTKGKTYYIRTKGEEGQKHTISYQMYNIEDLSYAKKVSYTFTNASFNSKKNSLILKIKTRKNGNLSFMCNTNNEVSIEFLNNKKKVVSDTSVVSKHNLTGIGVKENKVYYVRLWKTDGTSQGITDIDEIKYQIKNVSLLNNSSKGSAKKLSNSAENLIPVGKKGVAWYKIELKKKKKLSITFESRLYSNSGKGVKIYICNEKGNALHKNAIYRKEIAISHYKKKYKMEYPRKEISTGVLPEGTYYIKVVNNNKKTSGSYKLSWK